MTEAESKRMIEAAERITNEALRSKETMWQLLIEAGIYTEEDKRKHEQKLERKQKRNRK